MENFPEVLLQQRESSFALLPLRFFIIKFPGPHIVLWPDCPDRMVLDVAGEALDSDEADLTRQLNTVEFS
jgi:hypothetical protein